MKKNTKKSKPTKNLPRAGQHKKKITSQNNTVKGVKFDTSFRKSYLFWILAIFIITAFAYYPTLDNELTNWDDKGYVIDNENIRDLSSEKVAKLFYNDGLTYEMGNYHPLTMLTLAIDYHFCEKYPPDKPDESVKPDPFLFHLHNATLHLFNTVLVFVLAFMLAVRFERKKPFRGQEKSFALPIAIISSLLFGLNAIHVESVAWVAERKDVLYSFYFILSLIFYILYTDKRDAKFLIFSIITFLLSLLSKGQAVSLAVTLIAIDFFLGRNLKDQKVIIEKIPYFALALIFGLLAIKAQQHGDAIHDIDEYPFYQRIAFASYAFVMYIAKMLVPINLSAIYPYPHPFDGGMPAYYWIMPFLVGGVIYIFIKALKNNKELAFAILFFSINIFLLLQLLPVGSAIMADRYCYIPSIGFFLLAGFAFKWLAIRNKKLIKPLYALIALYSVFLTVRTLQQSEIWASSLSLWDHSLKVSPRGVVAWNNRGSAKDKLELKEEAIADFTEAVRLKPDYTHAYYNRGTALKDLDRFQEAITDFNEALKLDPNFQEAFHNRGIALEGMGDLKGAVRDYTKALNINPDKANIYASRGVAKGKMSQGIKEKDVGKAADKKIEWLNRAIKDFNLSISKKQINSEAYSNRGFAKVQIGQIKKDNNIILDGIKDYNTALEHNPKADEPHYNRGLAYLMLKDTVKAISDFQELLRMKPDSETGLSQLAVIKTKQLKYDEAISYYKKLTQLHPSNAHYFNYLGNIYFNTKNWTDAIKMYDVVLKATPNHGLGYLNRGLAKINNGQKEEGCKDLTTAANGKVKGAAASLARYCK